jgi:hypothetical protein
MAPLRATLSAARADDDLNFAAFVGQELFVACRTRANLSHVEQEPICRISDKRKRTTRNVESCEALHAMVSVPQYWGVRLGVTILVAPRAGSCEMARCLTHESSSAWWGALRWGLLIECFR